MGRNWGGEDEQEAHLVERLSWSPRGRRAGLAGVGEVRRLAPLGRKRSAWCDSAVGGRGALHTRVAHRNPLGGYVKPQKPRTSDFSVWNEAQIARAHKSSSSSRIQGHCAREKEENVLTLNLQLSWIMFQCLPLNSPLSAQRRD